MFSRLALLVFVLHFAAGFLSAQESHWNQFRGHRGLGIASSKKDTPIEFDQTQNLLWKCQVGKGISSPCVWGDKIFLTAHGQDNLETICLNRATGTIEWRRKIVPREFERVRESNGPASPTPTSDGKHVFVYFGSYGLLCYDFDGRVVWERKLPVAKNTFGTAASPIIANGRLIFCSDSSQQSFLEAIDSSTGKSIWKNERPKFKSGWSTPIFWENDGEPEIVVYGDTWTKAYAWKDGEERWSVGGMTDEPCITPVFGNGIIYATSYNMKTNTEVSGLPKFADLLLEYDKNSDGKLSQQETKDNKSILSRNDADGEGDHPFSLMFRFLDQDRDGMVTEEEWKKVIEWVDGFPQTNAILAIKPGSGDDLETKIVWQEIRGVPECPSPLLYKSLVYVVKNGGIITCLNAETGKLIYRGRLGAGGPYYASPIVAGNLIYLCSARGVVTVIEIGEQLRVLANNDLKERIMATPAVVDGNLYVRTEEMIYAFGFK